MTKEKMKRLAFEAMVNLAKTLVLKPPRKFRGESRQAHSDWFEISKVLIVKEPLENMHEELAMNGPKEDYHLEHLGFEYLTEFK